MKKVVSFSGGRTSAYLCYLMKEKFGDDVDFIYMDTGAEHPKTYEFIRSVNRELNLNLVCLRTDFSTPLGAGNNFKVVEINSIAPDLKPFTDMVSKYGVPYIGGMFCTDRMKLVPFTKYCNEKYGRGNYETWLGIRADELPRVLGKNLYEKLSETLGINDDEIIKIIMSKPSERDSHFVVEEQFEWDIYNDLNDRLGNGIRYLAEISDFEKQDIIRWWSNMPFDLEIKEWNGNCVFCPKKSNLKIAAAQRDNPEFYHNYLTMLYSDEVRVDEKTGHWSQMYRGKRSLEQVVSMFDGSTGDEIKSRIRGGKMTDSGSCSESCEVFNCSI
jgi:hypothetical protein